MTVSMTIDRELPCRTQRIYVVAPDGQAGGGMGRVKDYILEARLAPGAGYQFVSLITRDARGAAASLGLMIRAVLTIWAARLRGKVALVHVNLGDNGSAVRKGIIILLSRAVGVPVLLHLHAVGLERQYAAGPPLLRWLIRLPFRSASAIAVLGERWRRWLSEDLGIPASKIEIVWNGVPVPSHPDRQFPVSPERAELLFLGNLLERKGMSDLLHALKAVDAGPRDWHVTMAGGGDVDHYRTLAAELGIDDRTTFAGWVEQPAGRALLLRSDVLILPSYEEGLPLVILEALGMGTPVICTPVGSIAEVLSDGETALFVAPGDREGLATSLRRVIASPALCEQFSRQGSDLYARKFSLPAFHRALFDIYQERFGIELSLEGTGA